MVQQYDYFVGPSACCVAFVKENHPGILEKEGHVCQSAGKIYDLCDFIHDVIKPTKLPARFPHKVSIHNSCHGVRELFNSAPSELNIPYYIKLRDLLNLVEGIEVFEPSNIDECCGFGVMFAVEEQAVSVCMGRDKVKDHMATGAEYIVGAVSTSLMHMQGDIEQEHLPLSIIHIVEILASQSCVPDIHRLPSNSCRTAKWQHGIMKLFGWSVPKGIR